MPDAQSASPSSCRKYSCTHPHLPALCSLAIPLNLPFLVHLVSSSSDVCSGLGLRLPAAQRVAHAVFELLDAPLRAVAPPDWVAVALPPGAECTALLTFQQASRPAMFVARCMPAQSGVHSPSSHCADAPLQHLPPAVQLAIGFVLPALTQAALEARAFQEHQLQRKRAGLAPEAGWQAALYRWIAEVSEPFRTDPILALCLAVLLPCLLCQASLVLNGIQSMAPGACHCLGGHA